MTTTWRNLITEEMIENDDSFDNMVGCHFDGSIDDEFCDGFGGSEGCNFQLWTVDFVYFPIVYDGAEWVGSASRHIVSKALKHQGGE